MTNLTITAKPGWLIKAKTVLHRLEIEDTEAFSRANMIRQQIESMAMAAIKTQARLKALQDAAKKPDSFYSGDAARHQINVEAGNLEAEITELNAEIEALKQRAADMGAKAQVNAGVFSRAKAIFAKINGNLTTSAMGAI